MEQHRKFRQRIIFLVCSALTAVATNARDIAVNIPIDSVILYPEGAMVSRSGTLQVPRGEHRLVLADLPGGLPSSRLRLAIASTQVRLGSLELTEIHQGDLAREEERRLNEELQSLRDNRRVLDDDIATAQLNLKLLESLASGGDTATMKPSIAGGELANLLVTVSQQAARARQSIRDAESKRRELDKQIQRKEFELKQISTQRRITTTVSAAIQAEDDVNTTLTFSYPQANAQWSWLYEARLQTDPRNLEIIRQVGAQNRSGEDWNNIKLKLTTARAKEEPTTPELEPMFVELEKIEPVSRFAARENKNTPLTTGLEEVIVTASRVLEVTAIASQYLVEYQVPGHVTIKNGQQDLVLPVDKQSYTVDLVSRAVPDQRAAAFLEARFTYDNELPLQSGELQLYRDGAFIGASSTNGLLPKQEARLPFGVDERIRVQVQREQEGSKQGGFGRTAMEQTRLRYDLTSYHEQPMTVEILSRVPVSKEDSVKVSIARGATPADQADVDGKSGILLWKLTLQPQVKTSVRHYYDISYPRDGKLSYTGE